MEGKERRSKKEEREGEGGSAQIGEVVVPAATQQRTQQRTQRDRVYVFLLATTKYGSSFSRFISYHENNCLNRHNSNYGTILRVFFFLQIGFQFGRGCSKKNRI
jgi:hypothetical protein